MRTSLIAVAIATSVAAMSGAQAQEATPSQQAAAVPAGNDYPGDIIVTAQKRAENLQDVPLAVTALTSEALQAKGVNGLADFANVPPPGLFTQQFAGASQILILDIRGISNPDPGQGTLETGVAVYLDDVYLGRAQGLATELADPERIEVLRGPQGTLFGRNAEGGAVRIVSRKPSGEFSGRAKAMIGEYGRERYEAHLDLPEFAGFSIKLDYLNSGLDGFTKNGAARVAGLADQKNFGYEQNEGYRAAVRWKPSDGITVDYAYDRANSKSVGDWWVFVQPNPAPAGYATQSSVLDRTLGAQSVSRRTKQVPAMFNEPFVTKTNGHTLASEFDVNDNLQLKTISAWRNINSRGSQQLGSAYTVIPFELTPGLNSPLPAAAFTPDPRFGTLGTVTNPGTLVYGVTGIVPYAALRQRQFSQEVQLLGSTDTLEWVIGAYYFRERIRDTRQTMFSGFFLDTVTDGGFSNFVGTNPFALPFPGQGATSQVARSRSYAAFAQATWSPDFADGRLHITPGLRYTNDKKDAVRDLQAGVPSNLVARFKESRVDPALTIAYDVTPDINLFTRYAQAYRAGGAGVRDPNFNSFGAEVNKAYEVGLKTRLFDRRATLNIAGFYNDVIDRQLNVQVNPTDPALTQVINVPGSSPVWGGEVEFNARVLEGLDVGINYAYQKGRLPKARLAAIDPGADFFIQNLPKNSGTFTVDYVSPDLGFGKLAFHADYAWADSWNGTVRVPKDAFAYKLKRDVANVRLALQDVRVGPVDFMVAGFVRNVFNTAYPVYNSPSSNAILSAPRTAGVEVGLKF